MPKFLFGPSDILVTSDGKAHRVGDAVDAPEHVLQRWESMGNVFEGRQTKPGSISTAAPLFHKDFEPNDLLSTPLLLTGQPQAFLDAQAAPDPKVKQHAQAVEKVTERVVEEGPGGQTDLASAASEAATNSAESAPTTHQRGRKSSS